MPKVIQPDDPELGRSTAPQLQTDQLPSVAPTPPVAPVNADISPTPEVVTASTEQATPVPQTLVGGEPMDTSNLRILYVAAATMAIGLLLAYILVGRSHEAKRSIATSNTPTQPTQLEKKLAKTKQGQQQLTQLRAYPLPIYLPASLPIQNVEVSKVQTSSDTPAYFVYYGSNVRFGQGITAGSYGFSLFSLTSSFNPPSDCGSSRGGSASDPEPCTAYAQAAKDTPAYYRTGSDGGITNTTVDDASRITMYERRGKEVIVIEGVGDTPSDLYNILQSMKRVRPVDLPSNTFLNFQ